MPSSVYANTTLSVREDFCLVAAGSPSLHGSDCNATNPVSVTSRSCERQDLITAPIGLDVLPCLAKRFCRSNVTASVDEQGYMCIFEELEGNL